MSRFRTIVAFGALLISALASSLWSASATASPVAAATTPSDEFAAEITAWLNTRSELGKTLRLAPSQQPQWQAFEAATSSPLQRARAMLASTAAPEESDALAYMDHLTRMKEAITQDTADWLGALRALDTVLTAEQRNTLDAFLKEHPMPFE